MPKPSSRKTSSSPMFTKASGALRSKNTSKLTKSFAGSVLAQSKGGKK